MKTYQTVSVKTKAEVQSCAKAFLAVHPTLSATIEKYTVRPGMF